MKTTFSQVKSSSIPRVLGLCSTDIRLADYVNEAIERLLCRPEKWWGAYERYAICMSENLVTWPRRFATIETAAVCNEPVRIRNSWYEFLPNGPGVQETEGECEVQLINREGNWPTFEDIIGDDKKLKVYADVDEAEDCWILVQGYDENDNWIRTHGGEIFGSGGEFGGSGGSIFGGSSDWFDGELISVNHATPQTSEHFFTKITGIVKPQTNGVVRLYEYDTTLATNRAIGYYAHDETNPSYRRSLVTGVDNIIAANDCTTSNLIVVAKLEFVPVSNDNDFLLIPSIPALKDMCQAIKKYDAGLFDQGVAFEEKAVQTLDNQLGHYLGDGAAVKLNILPGSFALSGVENMM
jgi:hypothetical protein